MVQGVPMWKMLQLRPIPGYPGYFACSDGRILSMKGDEPHILKPSPHKRTGHLRVKLYKKGCPNGRTMQVHRLVCWAFHGPPPGPSMNLVLHGDHDETNNRPGNLSWGSYSKNNRRTGQVWFSYPDDSELDEAWKTWREAEVAELRERAARIGAELLDDPPYEVDEELGF